MAEDFQRFVCEQLAPLDALVCRKMFGGYGLYGAGTFFGIVYGGRLYFKTTPNSRGPYLEQGMSPFRPNEKQALKNYYEVPVEVLEDTDMLCTWAKTAIASAGAES